MTCGCGNSKPTSARVCNPEIYRCSGCNSACLSIEKDERSSSPTALDFITNGCRTHYDPGWIVKLGETKTSLELTTDPRRIVFHSEDGDYIIDLASVFGMFSISELKDGSSITAPVWGAISGDIEDQTDLIEALEILRATVEAEIPVNTSDLVNDSDFVADANYVHTDNNYTTAEKTKLAGLKNYDDTEVKADIADLDANKVDKVAGKQLSTEDYTSAEKTKLAGLSNYDDTEVKADIAALDANKVDKVAGKQLSTEDYTTAEKTKLAGITPVTLYSSTGQNTDGAMTQKATTNMVFLNGDNTKVAIGKSSTAAASAQNCVSIGASSQSGNNGVSIGYNSKDIGYYGSVALGAYSKVAVNGSVSIGDPTRSDLYNSTGYRLLTNVYDPQAAHDAATKGYVDTAVAGAGVNEINSTDWSGLWQ